MGGYNVECYTQSIGPLSETYEEIDATTLCDAVSGVLLNLATVSVGTLNGVLDNTATSGLHAIAKGANITWPMTVAIGIQAAPAMGDPVFCGNFEQSGYQSTGDKLVTVTVPFVRSAKQNQITPRPWGVLLHASGAEIAPNASGGVDGGAATATGGYFVYHLLSSNGTVTLKAQDSANNSAFSDITTLTSGSIDASVTPTAGIVSTLTATAAIRQYTRWQLVLGTATTATFVMSIIRGR